MFFSLSLYIRPSASRAETGAAIPGQCARSGPKSEDFQTSKSIEKKAITTWTRKLAFLLWHYYLSSTPGQNPRFPRWQTLIFPPAVRSSDGESNVP